MLANVMGAGEEPRIAQPQVHVSEWEPRLTRGTALLLRSRTRAVRTALTSSGVGISAGTAGVVIAASFPSETVGLVLGVAALMIVALTGLITAGAFLQRARRQRFRAEGAAVSVLLPRHPTVTAAALAPHLRSITAFDRWASTAGLQPAVAGAHLPQWHWTPGVKRPVLAGATAFALRQAADRIATAAIAVFGVLAVILLIDRGPAVDVRIGGGLLGGGLLAASAVSRLLCERRAAIEYRGGYTTLTPANHVDVRGGGWTEPDVRTGVDLVDARSGAVLRASGAAGLSVRESAHRLLQVVTAQDGESHDPTRETVLEPSPAPRASSAQNQSSMEAHSDPHE